MPFATIYAVFFLVYEVIPIGKHLFEHWWGYPTIMTLSFIFLFSMHFGIKECFKASSDE